MLIIDSATYACPEPSKEWAVGPFFRTIRRLNLATIRHTAFRSFVDLCVDPGGAPWYRPTLRGLPKLADAYDRFQSARGDSRRAFRGL